MNPIFVKKSDGTDEQFDIIKLEESLSRSGAQPTVIDKIIRTITEDLKNRSEKLGNKAVCDVTAIYKQAFSMLKKMSVSAAARYSLRRSIMEIGPTGFPFEEFVAELFKAQGMQTLTDQMVLGKCVPHEVDVVAWNKKKLLMAEVKYHNELAGKTDLKVALYVKARFDDLQNNTFRYGGKERKMTKGILVTNTKFSSTAIQYGECANLNMLGWNYPYKHNLHDMIIDADLLPVTVLTTLSQSEKKMFLANNIVLSRQLGDFGLLKSYGFDDIKAQLVMREVYAFCRDCIKPGELILVNKDAENKKNEPVL